MTHSTEDKLLVPLGTSLRSSSAGVIQSLPIRQTLIREGNPAKQARQFGYNTDFIGFHASYGTRNSDHGLLVVNHEYTNAELMFADQGQANAHPQEMVDIEIAAHGLAVIEVERDAQGAWSYKSDSSIIVV